MTLILPVHRSGRASASPTGTTAWFSKNSTSSSHHAGLTKFSVTTIFFNDLENNQWIENPHAQG